MKRVGNLWNDLCSTSNAVRAINLGTVNKRKDSVVKRMLGYTDNHPDHVGKLDPQKVARYAKALVEALSSMEWRPSPMRHCVINPPYGKRREIDCPALSDHIVHWMLILSIKPIIMRGMYEHSYGSIPGRGIDGARRAVERWVQHDEKAKYFVKLDIRKFYPNIDQEKLKASFRRAIKDPRVLDLVDKVIGAIPSGLPIGAYTSQWFANFFLQSLDHYIAQELYKTRRGKRLNYVAHYLRYMDDMLLIGTSKRDLEKAVREVMEFARKTYGLEIKNCWEIRTIAKSVEDVGTGIAPIDIVGYRFYQDHTEVRGKVFLHTSRIAARIVRRLEKESVVLIRDAQAIVSLCGWFSHADSEYFFTHYIYNRISIKFMREVISYASKNGIDGEAARVFCSERKPDGHRDILFGRSGGAARRRYIVECDCLDDGLCLDGEP